ncbi:hypothetical protein BDZ89DRAFT_1058838 [Hymenopellis radicata]|nr:hypothetical protein BDZ89DRAFT_1058838 [Hymenopellis radicata]
MTRAEPFTEAQIAYLEREMETAQFFGQGQRPRKSRSCMTAIILSEMGREVTSQEVGRWYSARLKALAGEPRLKHKTPEQLAILEASFYEEIYPDVPETIRVMEITGLKRSQVAAWFCRQRKKLEEEDPDLFYSYTDNTGGLSPQEVALRAKAQWSEYKRSGGDTS